MTERHQKPGPYDVVADMERVLNSKPQSEQDGELLGELRRLVALWLDSGPNTEKLLRDNPGCFPLTGTCIFQPTASGKLTSTFFPAGDGINGDEALAALLKRQEPRSIKPAKAAMLFFLQFATADECERLSGPCKCGCGKFFLCERKQTKRRKVYCKGHGSKATATQHMKRKQAERRAPQVERINRAVALWVARRKRGDWYKFAAYESGAPNEPGVATATLKLWEKKGYIDTPEKLKRARI